MVFFPIADLLGRAELAREDTLPAPGLEFEEIGAVSGADDGLLLQTESGSLALTNAPGGYWMQRTAVPEDSIVTIPVGYQMIVVGEFTVAGELVADGDLVIL